MRARSAAASVVRHVGGAAAEATLIAALVATVALVLSPLYVPARFLSGTGSADAAAVKITLSMASADAGSRLAVGGDAAFVATRSVSFGDVLWVTNKCYDASGALVQRSDLPVVWGSWNSVVGIAGAFEVSGPTCVAYATWRPWTDRPIRGTIVEYRAPVG